MKWMLLILALFVTGAIEANGSVYTLESTLHPKLGKSWRIMKDGKPDTNPLAVVWSDQIYPQIPNITHDYTKNHSEELDPKNKEWVNKESPARKKCVDNGGELTTIEHYEYLVSKISYSTLIESISLLKGRREFWTSTVFKGHSLQAMTFVLYSDEAHYNHYNRDVYYNSVRCVDRIQ